MHSHYTTIKTDKVIHNMWGKTYESHLFATHKSRVLTSKKTPTIQCKNMNKNPREMVKAWQFTQAEMGSVQEMLSVIYLRNAK